MDVCNSDYGKNLSFGKTEVYVDGNQLSIAGMLFQIIAPQNVANQFVLRGTDEPIRALSWKQPFATLMLKGKIETRTWSTKYRGWVLICASAQPYTDKQIKEISGDIPIVVGSFSMRHFRGKAIAIGYLTDCRPMTPEDESKCFVKYRPGLFCHVYSNVTEIESFPWKGAQGWRTLDQETKARIKPKTK